MTLTRNQIAIVHASLNAVAQEKEGKALFKFSAKTAWNIVKNLRITTAWMEDLDTVRNRMIKEVSAGKERLEPGTPEHAEFVAKWNEFIHGEENLPGLLSISEEDLNLEVNDIPLGVVVGLMHIIK